MDILSIGCRFHSTQNIPIMMCNYLSYIYQVSFCIHENKYIVLLSKYTYHIGPKTFDSKLVYGRYSKHFSGFCTHKGFKF